jgi:RNA polymerase sigma-70 factor (ECF subfamily)
MTEFRRELVALLPRLRRFALTLSQAQHEADDLVQAAVERALRNADSWTPGTALDSWMYRIIQNLWRDELRAHRRRAEPLDEVTEVMGEDGREVNLKQIQWAETRAALASLPEDQRLVLSLVVLDGLSYQQAAETLDVPIGTVMSRLHRGRKGLQKKLWDFAVARGLVA